MPETVDKIVRHEAIRFIEKDRTKLKLVLGMYALSLKDRELGKVARASYFFARHLDDILDGERTFIGDPVEYALTHREQIETGVFDRSSPLSRLAEYSIPILDKRAKHRDNPRGEFVRLIDAMVFDHDRRQARRTLTYNDLQSYYSNSLDPGLNLMLIGFESDIRAADIPAFSPNLGRLYSVRDLKKDWQLGIINIPDDVLGLAELDAYAPYDTIRSNRTTRGWRSMEIIDAGNRLMSLQGDIAGLQEPLTSKVINGLANSAIKSV